jgi:hypothetical protein
MAADIRCYTAVICQCFFGGNLRYFNGLGAERAANGENKRKSHAWQAGGEAPSRRFAGWFLPDCSPN